MRGVFFLLTIQTLLALHQKIPARMMYSLSLIRMYTFVNTTGEYVLLLLQQRVETTAYLWFPLSKRRISQFAAARSADPVQVHY